MKKVQVNYLEAKAAMELKMEAFYKECSKIEAKYNIEDDEQFEKMCDEQEDKRSEMGIFQYEQALTKATEELLTDLEKTIRSKPMARIITKMDIGSDIDLVLKEGKCNWKVRQKLIDLALHKIVY